MSSVTAQEWVVLLFQLPSRPTAARVRTWRRLQHLGAVSVKNSGWALPLSDASREDIEWLRADIRAAGGDAVVLLARCSDGQAEADLRAAHLEARRREYVALQREAPRLSRQALADRLAHLDAIDHFGAGAASRARAAILERLRTETESQMSGTTHARLKPAEYRRRTWVTRKRPGIDRFASAWLIQRFIDPQATFRFADAPPAASSKAVPFDMFGVEFGHQGEGCTFETLCAVFAIQEPAVARIAAIVHDLDLKDGRFAAQEAPTVGTVIEGMQLSVLDDEVLLEQGMALFESLYRAFEQSARSGGPRPVARSRTRAPSRRGKGATRPRRTG